MGRGKYSLNSMALFHPSKWAPFRRSVKKYGVSPAKAKQATAFLGIVVVIITFIPYQTTFLQVLQFQYVLNESVIEGDMTLESTISYCTVFCALFRRLVRRQRQPRSGFVASAIPTPALNSVDNTRYIIFL